MLTVVVMKRDDPRGIDERLHEFFVAVLAFLDTIPPEPTTRKLIEQHRAARGICWIDWRQSGGGTGWLDASGEDPRQDRRDVKATGRGKRFWPW
jgi:hypothetical protein